MSARSHALKPVFLLGATACGKTAVAIELVKSLPLEIISVDSALIYRKMNIGTAKPDKDELAAAPHRLIDIIEPWETYSVSDFISDAQAHIQAIQSRGNIPLLVGGTMLYYKALESGLSAMPSADETIRASLEKQAEQLGWPAMHEELKRIDPASAERIHPNDPQRLQRALEVWHASGKTMTEWHQQAQATPGLEADKFALFPKTREKLHQRIEQRFDLMLENGFIEEVEHLRTLPDMHCDLPSMRCVGYRQVWDYLDGNSDHDDMRNKGIASTRQLAKRQITWMRKMQDLELFDSFECTIEQITSAITQKLLMRSSA